MWIYMRKRRIFNHDLVLFDRLSCLTWQQLQYVDGPVGTVRLSLSIEETVSLSFQKMFSSRKVPAVDHKRSTVLVRMKKRKSIIYKRMVRYDFTITWQGSTAPEAKMAEPSFEVEIEMLDLGDIRKLYGNEYVLVSLLQKSRHLFDLLLDVICVRAFLTAQIRLQRISNATLQYVPL